MKIEIIKPEATYDIRHKILRPHQDLQACHYPGDFTATTFHLGAFDQKNLVSIGSFYSEKNLEFKDESQYRLRGMATLPEVRGRGAARDLVLFGEDIIKQRGVTLIWFNAREVAFPFYTKVGYQFHGEFFELPGIGRHKVMFKVL